MQPHLEKLLILYARSFPIRRGKLRVVDALWRVATGYKSPLRVANLKYGAFKMPCNLSEMLQRQFYFFGTYFVEEDILDCWCEAAKGGKVMFDVGANAGIYSLAALAIEPDAIVHAFEPTPEIAARLRETAELNGLKQLHVHEVAVSSANGHATLRRCRGDKGTNEGMNFIDADLGGGGERVTTVCLDQFCKRFAIRHIDLLKFDMQRYEQLALKGGEHLIRDGRVETIFMELNWGAGVTCGASESINLLQEAGYSFAKPGKRLHWRKSGVWLRALTDVVARRIHQTRVS
jgi:FkbM family methyltransferase